MQLIQSFKTMSQNSHSKNIVYSPRKPLETIKLCKDCKFYKPVLFRDVGTCQLCGTIDITNGHRKDILASDARMNLCGIEGDFYEKNNDVRPFPHLYLQSDVDFWIRIVEPVCWTIVLLVICSNL